MPKNVKLLLTESVDSLGIVGDVVNVRTGYARNFLLPRAMATTPTEEAVKAVAAKRAEAERQLAELRKEREALIKKLSGIEVTIQRSCNDLGHLYASVTQQEIAGALATAGYQGVKPRDVRLNQNIKRVDTYDVHIKFDSDLDATIKLWVVADRKLDLDKKPEVEVDEHGNMIEAKPEAAQEQHAEAKEPQARGGKEGKRTREKEGREPREGKEGKEAKPAETGEKPAGDEKPRKRGKAKEGEHAGAAAPTEEKKVSTWGKPVEKPKFEDLGIRRPRRDRDERKKDRA
jgi:large subunit ribosomal protein L9